MNGTIDKEDNHKEKRSYKTETKIDTIDNIKWSGTVCVSTYSHYGKKTAVETVSSVEVYNLSSLVNQFQ